jgi:hypothetical protein
LGLRQKAKLKVSSSGATFIFEDFQVAMQIWKKLEEIERKRNQVVLL